MTPEIDGKFAELKEKYGANSLHRVEAMLYANANDRDPLQRGVKYIMPGLSTTPWLDTREFEQLVPLVDRLEKDSAVIKAEINQAIGKGSDSLINYQHYLGEQNDWDALYLFKGGKANESVRDIVPATWDIFKNELAPWHCPLLEVHFSVLKPGAVVKPHCDLWNFTINLHLSVDIPEDCSIVVAGEQRQWREGECLLFDYSYEHHAWNKNASEHRICLLMDVWHPDLTEAEKTALVFLITEIRKLMGE